MAFAMVNGMRIHYEIQGTGPNLLFIHGIGAAMHDAICIFNSPLSKHFTVLAFDPRGLGESESGVLPGSIGEMAEDAAGLAAAAGWEKYQVFGASMGGMVAQELVLRHPERVTRLVLGVTNAGEKETGPSPFRRMANMTTEETLMLSDTRQDAAWVKAHPEAIEAAKERFGEAEKAREANPTLVRGYGNQVQAVLAHDTLDRLGQISVPTLVFGGLYDGSNPPEVERDFAGRIPGAQLKFFESGHGNWFFDPLAWESVVGFLQET